MQVCLYGFFFFIILCRKPIGTVQVKCVHSLQLKIRILHNLCGRHAGTYICSACPVHATFANGQ